LVVGTRTRSGETRPRVMWLSLLAWDKGGGRGAVVSIPAHTATEVPGRGLLGLGQSLTSGGMPLLLVSTETLLGVPIDHYLELSMEDAGRLFDAVDPLSVDVPGEVRVGAGRNQARVVVPSGPQLLAAEHLVPLLFTVGMDGDDVELGTRQLAFWEGLLEKFRDDPQALTEGLLAASPALEASNLERPELAAFLTALVELPAEERTLATLPAEQVSVGGDQLYQVDEAEVRDFIQETVGATDVSDDEVRVQILNGNGVPGIGQEVAGKLVGEGFRVILSGNARTLNHQRTRIVSYDPTPTGVAMARRARSLLGTGQVLVSSQGQGIVDLTIVVGEDFPRKS
jgi:anionic cell wall polymer biosynthesis LytR-Cps2A-Psr (LCP) family protein